MTSDDDKLKFKQLLASCRPSKPRQEKVDILQDVIPIWKRLNIAKVHVGDILLECGLFGIFAEVLEDNFSQWQTNFPAFWGSLRSCTFRYTELYDLFPKDQIEALVTIFKTYMKVECWDSMVLFQILPSSEIAKAILLEDNKLYRYKDTLKYRIRHQSDVTYYFVNITDNNEAWQQKFLLDFDFMIWNLNDSFAATWLLLSNLATHPDAKVLLPRGDIVAKAAQRKNIYDCNTICALLSDDNDLEKLQLDSLWLEELVQLLPMLLNTGKAVLSKGGSSNLLDIVLPLANLSVVNSLKVSLGEKCIPALMQLIIIEKLRDSPDISGVLRARQEASRALWNFAYEKSNLNLIAANNGLEGLKVSMERLSDPIIKKNIAGILFMFNTPTSCLPENRHIMISYNWGNQQIVKRIAQSLTVLGYKIWLDLERMEGSTLEANIFMFAEMALICVSQKYKDSPNCRMEGEYCVQRRVPFAPLMMQRGYKPDGWLGITLGTQLWYDFTDESNWENKMAALVKVIGERGKNREASVLKDINTIEVKSKVKPLPEWTLEDVHEWMKVNEIAQYFETFQTHEINGKALVLLKRKPSILALLQNMGITKLGDLLRIEDAIHHL